MNPNQNPEDQELAQSAASLRRQRTSLSIDPIPSNLSITRLMEEFNPLGLFDPLGNLVGLNFITRRGNHSHVTSASTICTGATIYKGPYQGALAHINSHRGSYYVLRTHCHQYFRGPRPTGWRVALMILRFVGPVNANAKPVPELAANNSDDFVVILLPQGAIMLPNGHPWVPLIVPPPQLVMEGVLVGRSSVEASEICQFYLE
ncbi:hypothetical protein FNAPI_6745 [Fusarium napiforme]|uniref:Uncharacterized protein n=1 Tax=Fusarium napiforme TaxID=42672 RepID=A0A8H5JDR9_9HYPO|nr:hypothetical protein FNAPI_6745 [Fusarium napiforme]